jgi:hypothetical protein
MVPLLHLFSLVWHSVAACCCAAEATRWQAWFSGVRGGRLSRGAGRQAMRTRSRSESVEVLEVLAEYTGNFDDFGKKRAEVVEVLAENTRDCDAFREKWVEVVEVLVRKSKGVLVWSCSCRIWLRAARSVAMCRGEAEANRCDHAPTIPKLKIDTALVEIWGECGEKSAAARRAQRQKGGFRPFFFLPKPGILKDLLVNAIRASFRLPRMWAQVFLFGF